MHKETHDNRETQTDSTILALSLVEELKIDRIHEKKTQKIAHTIEEYNNKPASKDNIRGFYNKIGRSSESFSDEKNSFLNDSVLVLDYNKKKQITKTAEKKIEISGKEIEEKMGGYENAPEKITRIINKNIEVIVLERLQYIWRDNGGKPEDLFSNPKVLAKKKPEWIRRFLMTIQVYGNTLNDILDHTENTPGSNYFGSTAFAVAMELGIQRFMLAAKIFGKTDVRFKNPEFLLTDEDSPMKIKENGFPENIQFWTMSEKGFLKEFPQVNNSIKNSLIAMRLKEKREQVSA